jgi:hypothetical protein
MAFSSFCTVGWFQCIYEWISWKCSVTHHFFEKWKTNLTSLAILFHFLCAQHVSDINIVIMRSLRFFLLNYHIGRIVFGSLCVGDSVWLGWSGIRVAGWSTESPTQRTKNITINVVIQQHSRKLLMMDILMSETCWAHKKWNKIASDIKLVFYSSTILLCRAQACLTVYNLVVIMRTVCCTTKKFHTSPRNMFLCFVWSSQKYNCLSEQH